MIRRIAILEPKGERLYLFSRYQLPRLGGVLLATILRDRGYEALAFFLAQREILTRELEREADLIAISSITATAPVAYALVDHYRCLGKRVVMGGPIGRAMVPIQTSRGCQVLFIGFDADTPATTRCSVDYGWETYDGHHVNFQPRHFSPWELQKAQIVAHIRFFRLGRVFRRLLSGSGRAWVIGLYAHGISRRWLHWEKPYLRRLLGCVTSISRALHEPAPGLWRAPRARGAPSAPR